MLGNRKRATHSGRKFEDFLEVEKLIGSEKGRNQSRATVTKAGIVQG